MSRFPFVRTKPLALWGRSCVRQALWAAVALLVLLAGGAETAQAQFAPAPAAREVLAEQTINLFARWEGRQDVDGFYAELPEGWTLEEAEALHDGDGGRRVPLSVRPSREADATHFLGAGETLRGAVDIVLRVRTGDAAGTERWALVPFAYRSEQRLRRLSAYRTQQRMDVQRPPAISPTGEEENRVLSFAGEGAAPLLLERERLPSLSTRAPFTVEAWLKTTGLGEVLLSTWDGEEQRPYPLELVVDASGHLRYYRGRPSHHESMVTPAPVADGTWHHVAVAHDPADGRTRLLLDGTAVDSLRGTVPLDPGREVVALGGRVPPLQPGQEEDGPSAAARASGFSGQVDEVHFWPRARTAETVRRTMRQPRPAAASEAEDASTLASGEAGPVLLHFESEEWPRGLFRDEPQGLARVPSYLRFYAPIANLRARAGRRDVSLSWTAPGRGTFVIERSTDGETFRSIGEREAQADRNRYSFTDGEAASQVVFYRIRQRFEGGTERFSGTLKVGRAAPPEQQEQGVTLMGNFPNPFASATTIAYQVHAETRVQLSVWDLTGQRVAVLVDKMQTPGYKEVEFRPENLSSGTYFIRLRADGERHTHKMALVN